MEPREGSNFVHGLSWDDVSLGLVAELKDVVTTVDAVALVASNCEVAVGLEAEIVCDDPEVVVEPAAVLDPELEEIDSEAVED